MSINLLPWRETLYKKSKKRVLVEVGFGVLLVFVCFCISQSRLQGTLLGYEENAQRLEKELREISKNYAAALDEKKRRTVELKIEDFLSQKSKVNSKLFQIIGVVSEQMPETLYLTGISRKKDVIYFVGKAISHLDVSNFLESIHVQINKQPVVTETSQTDGQADEISFEIAYDA